MSDLLTVENLNKRFGPRSVLSDVSFNVRGGEVLGLIGPNGAGKTTLFECLAGLLPTDDGDVRFRGNQLPSSRRKDALFYFPYAVVKDIDDFHDGEISLRFKLVAGQLDQCAGILFNLKPNGDYLTVRFNGKEDNVVLWTFTKGKRSFVKKGSENVPLQMNTWHTLQISVQGTNLQASLDGKHLLDYTLTESVSGKVGVWSKTDSVSYFDQYTVTR
jgi:energy-coupling factor transporter ATP-binding protein EcfA2